MGAGRGGSLFPGLTLRQLLTTVYAILSEGRDEEQMLELDEALGFEEPAVDETPEHGSSRPPTLALVGDFSAVA